MKLKNIFEEEIIGDEKIMVSLDNSIMNGIIRLNATASFIVNCLKENTTFEIITEKMVDKYHISNDLAENAVNKIISQLSSLNLIED